MPLRCSSGRGVLLVPTQILEDVEDSEVTVCRAVRMGIQRSNPNIKTGDTTRRKVMILWDLVELDIFELGYLKVS